MRYDMSSTIVTRACRLNNDGISLMISKRSYEDATFLISRALAMVKHAIADADERVGVEENGKTDSCGEMPSCSFLEATPQCSSKIDRKRRMRGSCTFTYSNPVHLTIDDRQSYSLRYLINLSFMLLYNLALTHHMNATDGDLSLARLRKAASLYELAFELYTRENIDMSTLHYMALLNNLGQVHQLVGRSDKARWYFEQVLSVIMLLNTCGQSRLVDNLHEFLENVLTIVLDQGSVAPAA